MNQQNPSNQVARPFENCCGTSQMVWLQNKASLIALLVCYVPPPQSFQVCSAFLNILMLVLPSAVQPAHITYSMLLYRLLSHFSAFTKTHHRGAGWYQSCGSWHHLDKPSLSCIVVRTEWNVSITCSISYSFHLQIMEMTNSNNR